MEVISRKTFLGQILVSVAGIAAGCGLFDTTREFRAQFINRTEHTIAARADGTEIGRVPPGGDLTFRFDARVLDYSGDGGPYAAEVTFSAYDLSTGQTTRGFRRTVYQDRTETVEVRPSDFNQ